MTVPQRGQSRVTRKGRSPSKAVETISPRAAQRAQGAAKSSARSGRERLEEALGFGAHPGGRRAFDGDPGDEARDRVEIDGHARAAADQGLREHHARTGEEIEHWSARLGEMGDVGRDDVARLLPPVFVEPITRREGDGLRPGR